MTKCNEWEGVIPNYLDYYGFVYLITNNLNNRKYIGKCSFWSSIRRKPLKGKSRVRLDKRESDWKRYYGSCNELLGDIKTHGENNFTRCILSYHKNKWSLAYAELEEQMRERVLHTDSYYNGIIHIRLKKRTKKQ